MKTVVRILAVVVAALAIALFVFGFFGYETHYGDITTTVIKSAGQMNASGDFFKTMSVAFNAKDDKVLTNEELDAAATSFAQRLSSFAVADYRVACDYGDGAVEVTIPQSEYFSSIVTYLALNKSFEVHTGGEKGTDTLVLTAADIDKGAARLEQGSTSQYYVFELSLTKEGKAKYAEATAKLAQERQSSGSTQFMSFWFGDSLLESKSINASDNSGNILLKNTSSLQASTIEELNIVLNSSPLPADMNYARISEAPARMGEKTLDVVWIAAVAVFAAAAAWFVIRYRASGAVAVICALGTAGGMMAIITGFYSARPVNFTFATLFAFIAVMFISFEVSLRDCTAIKSRFPAKSAISPVATGQHATLGATAAGYASIFAVACVLILFSRNGG
ncbi:MAG: hypothetical protein RSC55_09740, partial [Oscillospiraceae bacterium]